jgi:thiol-disulfide isomerase/thioredoxin
MRLGILPGVVLSMILVWDNAATQERPAKSYFRELGVEVLSEDSAPGFQLQTLGGDTLSLKEFGGRILILHFWATWCKPCREEMPQIEKLYQQTKNWPLAISGISIDKKADSLKIAPALREMQITFPNAPAFSGNIPNAYWTWGIPVSYLVNPKGRFIGRLRGSRHWNSNEMQRFLRQLIKENGLEIPP